MSERPIATTGSDASLGDLLQRLVADTGHLFRTELRLARSEVASGIRGAAIGAALIGVGVVLVLGAVFTFLGAVVGWLTPALGAGWAAAAVALGAAVVAGILIAVGVGRLSAKALVPTHAAASVRRDIDALQGK